MEFQNFPKMARLSREVIITEKIDGTNAQICIEDVPENEYYLEDGIVADSSFGAEGFVRIMRVGSRTRWIDRQNDNAGFANWAFDHAQSLMDLGPGRHFGEWWGKGIQRGYGLNEKRFSLFNTQRWCLHGSEPKVYPTQDPRITRTQEVLPWCCDLVPVLYQDQFETADVERCVDRLRTFGSVAAPGFMKPEGIIVFHTAANIGFKKTLDKDHLPKALANV